MPTDLSAFAWSGLAADDLDLYGRLLARAAPVDETELVADTRRSADQVRAALARLRSAGFVADGRTVAPGTALRALLHTRLAEAHHTLAGLESAAGGIDRLTAELVSASTSAISMQGVELVTGAAEIGRRAGELIDSARSEILVFNLPPYAQPERDPGEDEGPASSGAGRALLRGVQVRAVYGSEGLDFPGRVSAVGELIDLGMDVRVHPAIPTKLMVVDRTTILLPPSAAVDPLEQSLVVHDGLLVHVVVPLFEVLWASAVPFSTALTAPVRQVVADDVGGRPTPTDDERVLIALMASGLKDEAIARQLQVHVHTARRRITALVDRLGASTRFQAGLQAARLGWLDQRRDSAVRSRSDGASSCAAAGSSSRNTGVPRAQVASSTSAE